MGKVTQDVTMINVYIDSSTGYRHEDNIRHYKNCVTLDMMVKWRWYFEYRAAKVKVENPRRKVEMVTTPVHPPKKSIYERRLQGKKATITKYKNLLQKFEDNWDEVFPPEQVEPKYVKAKEKIARLEREYKDMLENPHNYDEC